MPFLHKKSVSISAWNSKMNINISANKHYGGQCSPHFSFLNLFFSAVTIESQNNWKAGTTQTPERTES
jgi:hypothetical protein